MNLPFISPGTKYKCATCPVMDCKLHLEIQCGKDGMKDPQHNLTLGVTTGCSLHLLEGSAGVGSTGHGLRGDAWFGSMKTATEIGIHGNEAVVQVKTNSGLYPKQFIDPCRCPQGHKYSSCWYCSQQTKADCCWLSL